MTSPITAVEAALFAALNVSSLTSVATGGVWNLLAPENTPLPYAIFQQQGGGDENLTPSRSRNIVYTVKGLATVKDTALSMDSAIDALLHLKTLSVSGWANFWTAREGDVNYEEVDDMGQVIYHVGGMYRIRIDS